MTYEEKCSERERHRKHRRNNAKRKDNERLRTAAYQRTIDSYKRTLKRKGKGKAHKEKGQTMPTLLNGNSKCYKSWKHLNGAPMREESMKVAIIFMLT